MQVYYTPQHARHQPLTNCVGGRHLPVPGSQSGHPECPTRLPAILEAMEVLMKEHNGQVKEVTRQASEEELKACHDPALIEFLFQSWSRAQKLHEGIEEIIPEAFPPHIAHVPSPAPSQSVFAQAGLYCYDTCTPIGPFSVECARQAAAAALDAAHELPLDRPSCAFVLARPPGHHATAHSSGGFCYFNTAALAAVALKSRLQEDGAVRTGRVAIVDLDYHHGNGTQEIFYHSSDVSYWSIHADPEWDYPYWTGRASEHGAGAGEGYNFNFPLPPASNYFENYAPVIEDIVSRMEKEDHLRPQAIVVSLGLDALEGDPVGSFMLQPEDYGEMARRLARLQVPVLVIFEGGYHPQRTRLADSVSHFLRGLEQTSQLA